MRTLIFHLHHALVMASLHERNFPLSKNFAGHFAGQSRRSQNILKRHDWLKKTHGVRQWIASFTHRCKNDRKMFTTFYFRSIFCRVPFNFLQILFAHMNQRDMKNNIEYSNFIFFSSLNAIKLRRKRSICCHFLTFQFFVRTKTFIKSFLLCQMTFNLFYYEKQNMFYSFLSFHKNRSRNSDLGTKRMA